MKLFHRIKIILGIILGFSALPFLVGARGLYVNYLLPILTGELGGATNHILGIRIEDREMFVPVAILALTALVLIGLGFYLFIGDKDSLTTRQRRGRIVFYFMFLVVLGVGGALHCVRRERDPARLESKCVDNMFMMWHMNWYYCINSKKSFDEPLDPNVTKGTTAKLRKCPLGTNDYQPFTVREGPRCPNSVEHTAAKMMPNGVSEPPPIGIGRTKK